MDTSVPARLAAIGIIFAFCVFIVYWNIRIAVRMLLRSRVSRAAKIIWPVMLVFLAACVVDAFCVEPRLIQVTRHTFQTNKLPPGASIRIAHLTDLHIEEYGPRERKMVYLTALAQPDIIVLTGDYRNTQTPNTEQALTHIAEQLCQIAPTYAIYGNWDSSVDMAALKRGGAKPLAGWAVIEQGKDAKIALGRVSWTADEVRAFGPKEIEGLYKVLLCHVPRLFDSAVDKDIDLMLVGHTHGGQIRLPVFGALMPNRKLVGKYQAGLYEKENSKLYVNRGIGMEGGDAPRVRFCCRPEVAVIDIAGKEK